jgi:BTB/POZ domain
MSCSSSNNNAGVGNDNPRSIGIVSPLAVGAAVVPNVVPDTNDDTNQQHAVAYPQNHSHRGGSIATAATAGPFSPLTTAPPPRTLMSAPYSSTAAGQISNDNNSKNLFDSSPPPSTSLLSPTATSKCNKAVVVLNVGGCQFTTSRSTLCSVEGSQLEAMFSGRHVFCAHQMEDGSYFIDRDGR